MATERGWQVVEDLAALDDATRDDVDHLRMGYVRLHEEGINGDLSALQTGRHHLLDGVGDSSAQSFLYQAFGDEEFVGRQLSERHSHTSKHDVDGEAFVSDDVDEGRCPIHSFPLTVCAEGGAVNQAVNVHVRIRHPHFELVEYDDGVTFLEVNTNADGLTWRRLQWIALDSEAIPDWACAWSGEEPVLGPVLSRPRLQHSAGTKAVQVTD